ncbi:MAG: type III pantothenate kinase, partial [Deltaproteobacteria bacterium]|nr:type III pantothenate kinase [Deltaproteobacteria bacterium]
MLLTIDVGNTNISLGLFQEGQLKHHWRVETARARTADEFGLLFKQLFDLVGINFKKMDGIVISNVVPTLQHILLTMCQRYFDRDPLWVTHETAKMHCRVDRAEEIGADRLCNAVAAWEKFKTAAIVVDFGTATTFDVVTAKGEYGGGPIAPGIGIAGLALTMAAAKLPRVEIAKPKRVVGRNTVECMQSGLYYGYVGLVDHLVELCKKEEGVPMKVIATGGLASLIAQESKTIESV